MLLPFSVKGSKMKQINLGDVVKQRSPYKPESETEHCRQIFNRLHQSRILDWRKWLGFTHGIVVEIISQKVDGSPHHVSLHLYDPITSLIYMCNPNLHPIPTYVDFQVKELELVQSATATGYQIVKGKP